MRIAGSGRPSRSGMVGWSASGEDETNDPRISQEFSAAWTDLHTIQKASLSASHGGADALPR